MAGSLLARHGSPLGGRRLAAVDAYIAKAQPFAQPILRHLREAVHGAVPDVEEAMKWSRSFFLYRGVILGNISAFKEHCSFGLWGTEMAETLRQEGHGAKEGMGSFGKITNLRDLPPLPDLEAYLVAAARLIDDGVRTLALALVLCSFSSCTPSCEGRDTSWVDFFATWEDISAAPPTAGKCSGIVARVSATSLGCRAMPELAQTGFAVLAFGRLASSRLDPDEAEVSIQKTFSDRDILPWHSTNMSIDARHLLLNSAIGSERLMTAR